MYKSILVPVDSTKLSLKALDQAGKLSAALNAKLVVTTVNPSYPTVIMGDGYMAAPISPVKWQESVAARNAAITKEVEKRLKGAAHEFAPATADLVYEGILAAAKKYKSDVIVMASHGRGGLGALLLGSETLKVLTHSKIPVLVVR